MSDTSSLTVIDWMTAILKRGWLILGCTILCAGISWLALRSSPPMYVSSSLLALSAEQAAEAETIMRSPLVIDRIAETYPALKAPTPEATRRRLNANFSWNVTAAQRKLKATLFQLDFADSDPQRAQAIINLMIDAWLETTKPKPILRARLEVEIARLEQQLQETNLLRDKLQDEAKTLVVPNSLQGELAGPLVRMLAERENLISKLAEKKGAFSGVSREIVVSPPTLPVENSVAVGYARVLVISGLLGAVLGMLLALLLEWFRRNRSWQPRVKEV